MAGAFLSWNAHKAALAEVEMVLPDAGRWVSMVTLPTDVELADALQLALSSRTNVTLELDGTSWTGTIADVGTAGNSARVQLVGGLGRPIVYPPAKQFVNSSIKEILTYMLGKSDDVLDVAGSDATILARRLKSWSINTAAPLGKQLSKLLSPYGARWRTTPSGSIRIEAKELQDITIPTDAKRTGESHPDGALTYALLEFDSIPQPGLLENVYYREVEILFLNKEGRRFRLLETPTYELVADRLGNANEFVTTTTYAAVVVKENSDGTYEIRPNDETIRGDGLNKVPVRLGLPNVTVKGVSKGTKCSLSFDSNDPSMPYISSFDRKSGDGVITVGEESANPVADGVKVDTELARIWNYLNNIITLQSPMGPTMSGAINKQPDPQSVQVKKLKSE